MGLPLFGGGIWDDLLKPKSGTGLVPPSSPVPKPTSPTAPIPQPPTPTTGTAPQAISPWKSPWASLMNGNPATEPPKTPTLGPINTLMNPIPQAPAAPKLAQAPGPAMGESFEPAQAGTMVRPNATPAPVSAPTTEGVMVRPNATPTPMESFTPPEVPHTDLSHFKADPLTEQGKLYEDYVLQGLKTGKFGELDAARGAYDRDSALRTTQASEGAKQAALRAGAAPGTALYQSIMNQNMGGANRANLEQGNDVNALGRDLIQKALDRAAGIETQAHSRADSERALKYGRADLEYERRKAEEAAAKGDQGSFLNSIEDSAVRSWAASQFAQGKTLQDVSAGIWSTGPDGRTVYNPQIAGLSPGKQNAANILDYLKSLGLSDEDAKRKAADLASNQMGGLDNSTQTLIADQGMQLVLQGQTPSDEQIKAMLSTGKIPQVSRASLPKSNAMREQFLKDHGNKLVSIDGAVYKVAVATFNGMAVPVFTNLKTGERFAQKGETLDSIEHNVAAYGMV